MKTTFDVSDTSEYTSIENEFNGQKSLEEMFACVWDLEEKHRSFPSNLVPSIKSEEKANKLRILGDRFYSDGKIEMSLSLYNMSLMVAPHPQLKKALHIGENGENDPYILPSINPAKYGGTLDGECRALADGFASRAILLYDLKLQEKSLQDINLALTYRCSEALRNKIVALRENCQVSESRLKDSAEKAREINEECHNHKLETTESSLKESKDDHDKSALKRLLTYNIKNSPSLPEPSITAPSLSSCVKVALTPSSGRGLIAERDIYPGEVLLVDRAYSVGLEVEELSTYCTSCLCLCLTPLPCPGCSEVIFCSEHCRQKGLSSEHWIECKILSTLIDMKVPCTYYPHKMLKSSTYLHMTDILKKLQEEEELLDQSQTLRGFSKEGLYNSFSYQAVRHLCTNKEKFSPEFLLRQCKHAYIFTKLLQMSGRFFTSYDGEPMQHLAREDFIVTGAVLLSHILMIHSNQFTISDQNQASKQIGSGLFPTASLVNHSCYQSTTRYSSGRDLILVARMPIQAGEEVTGTYTTDFSRRSFPMRKAILAKYHIDCKCIACERQWPTYEHLPKFRCIECKQTGTDKVEVCLHCRVKHLQCSSEEISLPSKEDTWRDTLLKIEQELRKALEVEDKLKKGEKISQGDCKALCQCIETAHRYIGAPCQFICSLENTLLSVLYIL
ncbi:SET and MYND domain-containing protein 4-like [Palaemon carinicauda]|uniref:SET and MYND domain-containing protein 4-like n=1 Tax=Palaemon carinicauda TaxID=392227 RepID=UPI0035B5B9CF